MKKNLTIAGLMVVLFLALGAANCAHADFTSIFTVGSSGSTSPKSVFTLVETPWLYLDLPSTGFNVTSSIWSDPNGNPFSVSAISGSDKYWFSLDSGLDASNNPVSWNSVKQLGLWNISAGYLLPFNSGSYANSGKTSFTVTAVPEPVSTALFILGGTALAVRRLFTKKIV